MTLHVFNPEHDIALSSGLSNFTAPHAARQLRHDLGFLPGLWTSQDDVVLVDNVADAETAWKRLRSGKRVIFIEKRMLSSLTFDSIVPWGWDAALCNFLQRNGLHPSLLPTNIMIDDIRLLSHRREASALLPLLRFDGTIGESYECRSIADVTARIASWGKVVLKAPWSSSGRGLRFVDNIKPVERWLSNLLVRQGSVMVEPYYNKVKDFGMEFESDGKGKVTYLGLSLFHTSNGAYTGNILATERAKNLFLNNYISEDLLYSVKQKICSIFGLYFFGRYSGPFGIDMMVVSREDRQGFLLHPCVEINLRRTMGHVALAWEKRLNPSEDDELKHVMRIIYSDNTYRIKTDRL